MGKDMGKVDLVGVFNALIEGRSMTVGELMVCRNAAVTLIADVAAARRERDEAIEAQEYAELEVAYLANEMMYEGNSIGWIASKAKNYSAALGRAWDAFREVGGKCDGNTELATAIRQQVPSLAGAEQ